MPLQQQSAVSHTGSTTWRIALFVLIVASIVWLGGVNIRALVGNSILKSGTVEFDEFLDPQAEREAYRVIAVASVAILISYAVVVSGSIVFLVTSPLTFKENGWLMMSAILFYIFVPIECYTLYLDWKLIYLEFYTTEGNDAFRTLFLSRVMALQGVPFIALLCYYTIIGLSVFQPMKRLKTA